MSNDSKVLEAYALAQERYAALGVDTEATLAKLDTIAISLHCWQGDDVGGFESPGGDLGGGLAKTGNYPGKARTPQELRRDLDMAYSLIPGSHRLALHAMYAEPGATKLDRNDVRPEHFANWVAWAKEKGHGLDFNPTYFGHPMAASGFTLSSYDKGVRDFWVEHGILCREIGAYFGRELGTTCLNNHWIPDGMKDTPADRKTPRLLLKDSLDRIFAAPVDKQYNLDAVEGKLFGIGAESYTVGSHEFYLGYAVANKLVYTLDSGHYHPTETISDKLSSVLPFVDQVMLHVSRGVRWDSDHVVILNDDLAAIMQEIVRGDYLDRVHIGLDFFDASINRIAAWTVGTRNALKALLMALVEPYAQLQQMDMEGNYTARLVLLEELKSMPFAAVWDAYCLRKDAPVGYAVMDAIREYERTELSKRG